MNPKCLQGPPPEATTCSDVKGAPWGFVLAPSPLLTLLLPFFTLTVPSPVSLLPSLVSPPPLPFLSTYILQTPERWGCRGSGHRPSPPEAPNPREREPRGLVPWAGGVQTLQCRGERGPKVKGRRKGRCRTNGRSTGPAGLRVSEPIPGGGQT